MTGFHEKSYRIHAGFTRDWAGDPAWQAKFKSWFDETTLDYERHRRMFEAPRHLCRERPDATWLTVGDGHLGMDAIRLRKLGVNRVLATDISEALLAHARERGLIDSYSVENAEHLSFSDEAFDYVLCKESFHHFPRPYLAVYEMLRVAREAVILIEPNDPKRSLARRLLFLFQKILRRATHFDEHRYEESANYVYAVSERELEKVCLGLNLPQLVVKGFSCVYVEGEEFIEAKRFSRARLKMRSINGANRVLTSIGASEHNILMCILCKAPLSMPLRERFRSNGWKILDMPRNPYDVS